MGTGRIETMAAGLAPLVPAESQARLDPKLADQVNRQGMVCMRTPTCWNVEVVQSTDTLLAIA